MERLLTILLTVGWLGLILNANGNDEYMTCARPVKSFRSSRERQHVLAPCDTMDHNKESWCTLPGPKYPWHSVRRFVFENQGLMRRMYGEVRQLSVLRMEFSGESNNLDESRDFGEFFKPITTFDPAMSFSTSFTTESIPTLVVTSSFQEFTSDPEIQEESHTEADDSDPHRKSHQGEAVLVFNVSDLVTTNEATTPALSENEEGFLAETGNPTEESVQPVTVVATNDDDIPVTNGAISFSTSPVDTTLGASHLSVSSTLTELYPGAGDKTRNEGSQVLFQDFEKGQSTIAAETPPIRSTSRQGVNACPVKEEVVAPYWANNTRGEVLALLNLYPFEQYIHWEKCTNEHRQMYCRDGCRCEQQYRLHRLLAFDPHNECRGIFSDWFRFPSCCVCKCYFDDSVPDRLSFNRSPRLHNTGKGNDESIMNNLDFDVPDVNGVDDQHFFYKPNPENIFRQPRK